MKPSSGICLFLIGALLCAAACSSGPKVIPRSKMEKIYIDFFMGDQWIMLNQEDGWKADTTLFYEPILQKYGYTMDDFNASNEYYLRDPLRYSRMLKKVALELDARGVRMQREIGAAMEAAETTEDNYQTTE